MKLDEWEKIIQFLKNSVDGIAADVLKDCDEVKAFGDLALLQGYVEKILREIWEIL